MKKDRSRSVSGNQPSNRSYGWLPDIPDQRDYLYRAVMPPVRLPGRVDLTQDCSSVEDQGNLGSCTAQAIIGHLEFLEIKTQFPIRHTPSVTRHSSLVTRHYTDLSRLFLYYNERVLEHSVKTDSGAMIRDGIKSCNSSGVCSEELWPYDIMKFAQKPPRAAYEAALEYHINTYHRLQTLSEKLNCLAEGYPFVFGFAVYESFESAKVARTGLVNMPEPGERMLGGHAVLAVGYDRKSKRFLVRNSWGTKWGKKGYFTMPFDYIDGDLSDDFWTIRR